MKPELSQSEKVFGEATEKLRDILGDWEEGSNAVQPLPKPDVVKSQDGLAIWFGPSPHKHQVTLRLDLEKRHISVRDEIGRIVSSLRIIQYDPPQTSLAIHIVDEMLASELFPNVTSDTTHVDLEYSYGTDAELQEVGFSMNFGDLVDQRFLDSLDCSRPHLYASLLATIGERPIKGREDKVARTGPFVIQLIASPTEKDKNRQVELSLREWEYGSVFAASREAPRAHNTALKTPDPIRLHLTPEAVESLVRRKLETFLRAIGCIPS